MAIRFNGRHYPKAIIFQAVRWYLAYALSYRDVEELMQERGIDVDHATIQRWVVAFSPQLEKAFRQRKRLTGNRLFVDETYIKVRGQWKFLYRVVDQNRDTVDFLLIARRNKWAVLRFFYKLVKSSGLPYKVNIGKSVANKAALDELNKPHNEAIILRQQKYLNNIVEQDHRRIKKLTRACLGFKNFYSSHKTIMGFELMATIKKGQMIQPEGEKLTAAEQFYSLVG